MDIKKMALALQSIALSLDDSNLDKIKPYLNTIEDGICDLIDKCNALEDKINNAK